MKSYVLISIILATSLNGRVHESNTIVQSLAGHRESIIAENRAEMDTMLERQRQLRRESLGAKVDRILNNRTFVCASIALAISANIGGLFCLARFMGLV